MQRFASVIGIEPGMIDQYRALHAAVWPDVLRILSASHFTNYSIYLRQPENLLFSYFEYTGKDFAADYRRMADEPITREWWKLCSPCQRPLASRQAGEWWASMPEVFHLD
ncbi:MAG: L-rhamnose mutarotase [Pseudomonadota bacterium]|nr:L-rhamnose mutarotase [Pseudomonadota bacterium]